MFAAERRDDAEMNPTNSLHASTCSELMATAEVLGGYYSLNEHQSQRRDAVVEMVACFVEIQCVNSTISSI